MKLFFLSAAVPLTKRITAQGKQPYPYIKRFTSHEEEIVNIADFFKALQEHARLGHCLLKGQLTRPLQEESRASATSSNTPTSFLCLDFDRIQTSSLDKTLQTLGLGDTSYILQYTASHDPKSTSTSAHVFMFLAKPALPSTLKEWLQVQNLTQFQAQVSLNPSKNSLHYPLDITTCQNDKLIYIAPPIFDPPSLDPFPANEPRIQLVKRSRDAVTLSVLPASQARQQALKALNDLRKAEGLSIRRTTTTKFIKDMEVLSNPEPCTVTHIIETEDHWRLDLNGGDSHAYLINKNNPEYTFDFKTGTWTKTSELVPDFWKEIMKPVPVQDGVLILGFRDLATANYYNGTYDTKTNTLKLDGARNEKQISDWYVLHGMAPPEAIPVWELCFEPTGRWVIDEKAQRINLFKRTKYMDLKPKNTPPSSWPTINMIICNMLATKPGTEVYNHFINWFDAVFQCKERPITAWVLHGIEGTGKGRFFNFIARPLIGRENTIEIKTRNLRDDFNGWEQNKRFICIDEVDANDFGEKGLISANLRNAITEPMITIRNMHASAREYPNHACYLFTSNKPQPVIISETDRRYNVGNHQNNKLPDHELKDIEKELTPFAQFLLAHKVDMKHANSIVNTEARDEIKRLSKNSNKEVADWIKAGEFDKLWYMKDSDEYITAFSTNSKHLEYSIAYTNLLRKIGKSVITGENDKKLTRSELSIIFTFCCGKLYDSPNKFTIFLGHNEIKLKRLRYGKKNEQGLEVEWKISEEVRAELIQTLFDQKRQLRRVK
jgi:hypothetical protein